MHRIIIASFLVAFALQAEMKIAVIELERAMNEVTDGKTAKSKLEEEFKKKQELLDKKQVELKKLQETFQSQAAVMTEKARQEKGMELQSKFAEAQQLHSNMQQDMMKKEKDFMSDILKKMKPIVEDIAQKEGYTAVLNKTDMIVVYSEPGFNITEKVMQRYNASFPAALPISKKKK